MLIHIGPEKIVLVSRLTSDEVIKQDAVESAEYQYAKALRKAKMAVTKAKKELSSSAIDLESTKSDFLSAAQDELKLLKSTKSDFLSAALDKCENNALTRREKKINGLKKYSSISSSEKCPNHWFLSIDKASKIVSSVSSDFDYSSYIFTSLGIEINEVRYAAKSCYDTDAGGLLLVITPAQMIEIAAKLESCCDSTDVVLQNEILADGETGQLFYKDEKNSSESILIYSSFTSDNAIIRHVSAPEAQTDERASEDLANGAPEAQTNERASEALANGAPEAITNRESEAIISTVVSALKMKGLPRSIVADKDALEIEAVDYEPVIIEDASSVHLGCRVPWFTSPARKVSDGLEDIKVVHTTCDTIASFDKKLCKAIDLRSLSLRVAESLLYHDTDFRLHNLLCPRSSTEGSPSRLVHIDYGNCFSAEIFRKSKSENASQALKQLVSSHWSKYAITHQATTIEAQLRDFLQPWPDFLSSETYSLMQQDGFQFNLKAGGVGLGAKESEDVHDFIKSVLLSLHAVVNHFDKVNNTVELDLKGEIESYESAIVELFKIAGERAAEVKEFLSSPEKLLNAFDFRTSINYCPVSKIGQCRAHAEMIYLQAKIAIEDLHLGADVAVGSDAKESRLLESTGLSGDVSNEGESNAVDTTIPNLTENSNVFFSSIASCCLSPRGGVVVGSNKDSGNPSSPTSVMNVPRNDKSLK